MTRRTALNRWVAPVIGLIVVAVPAVATAQLRWGRPTAPRAGACFYRDAGFRGDYFCLRAGEDAASIPAGLNDEISSVRTFGDAEVTIYRDRRFTGRSVRLPNDVHNLRDIGWNDRLSSIAVRVRSRRGDGYDRGPGYGRDRDRDRDRRDDRRGMSRAQAEQIVRRAYLSVLRREPDPGSRGWVERVLRDGWTEADVARELRRSDEYRRRR